MEYGANGANGVNVPSHVNLERREEAESVTVLRQLTAAKTAKDQLNNPASKTRTYLAQVKMHVSCLCCHPLNLS